MNRFLNIFLALMVVMLGALPPALAVDPSGDTGTAVTGNAGQSTQSAFPGVLPETRFKNNVRIPNQLILGGTMNANSIGNPNVVQWSNIPALIARPAAKSGSALDTTMIFTAPTAARTYTVPDAGANANFMLDQGNYAIAGVFTFPAGGFVLKGTSFNDTIAATASQAQATTLTVPDAGAATANILLDKGTVSAVTIQHVAVPLSSANVLGMYATPVQLIAAGAAGTNIVVHKAMLTMVTTSTQYAGGGIVTFQLGSTANGAGTATTATVAAAVVNAAAGTSYTTVIPVSYTGLSATGLFISNQTAAFTTGTGTGTVDIWYSIK